MGRPARVASARQQVASARRRKPAPCAPARSPRRQRRVVALAARCPAGGASRWSSIASSRCGHSGWPAPMSWRQSAGGKRRGGHRPRSPVRVWSRRMDPALRVASRDWATRLARSSSANGRRSRTASPACCRRPPADRGRAGRRQDHPGAHAGGVAGLDFRACQFTADLMPSDLIGVSVFERAAGGLCLPSGPVFAQVLLADEINRAGPKTQSALLEAMEEQQVTVENETDARRCPLLRDRHAEPERPARHLPAAREPARPLPDAHHAGYPDRASRAQRCWPARDRRDAIDALRR